MNKKSAFKKIAVLFGGLSAEHEISIITALQAIQAMDATKYEIVPVYLDMSGNWYTGKELLQKSFYKNFQDNVHKLIPVTLLPEPSGKGLLLQNKQGYFNRENNLPIDVYFLCFHGQYGEDGCVQGLLELANAAYTGCNLLSSAIAMHKYHCKIFLQAHHIPTLPSVLLSKDETINDLKKVHQKILHTQGLEEFPLFIKPAHLGSSVGISRAENILELNGALAKSFYYDDEALVEPCVDQLFEINVAVMDADPPRASVVEIPVPTGKALTYEDKYMRNGKKTSSSSQGMAALPRKINPADLDIKIKNQVIDYALKAFKLLKCSGVGRFDFIFDLKKGSLYFNELNPIPGSLSFYLWEKSSPRLLYTEMIDIMISQAIRKKQERLFVQKNIGFKALR